ncbi:MAG TPA: pyridoxal-phosphate dependent enzyme [Vicinamibacterales bacterium]|nr:pyridoxal-phosphate dependent enzyme [Vicinamibacterales bacterium]
MAEIARARDRIAGRIRRTPLIHSPWLSERTGGSLYLKLESLQVTNSFKARGALNAVIALSERLGPGQVLPTVVSASAGNHGRALAWAAASVGLRVVIFTPRGAPEAKLAAIRRHGATLRAEADDYEGAERMAKEFARETGGLYLSPYSHPDLLSAIGTIALEVVDDLPDVSRVVVPVGGGGLIAGIAQALHAVHLPVETVGVEVEASHPFTASLAAGRIVEVIVGPTLADGLAGNMDPENIAFPIVQRLVTRIALAAEDDLAAAIRALVDHEHLIAEGAGATAVAAVLAGRIDVRAGKTVIIVSGSNIDTARLLSVLQSRPGVV